MIASTNNFQEIPVIDLALADDPKTLPALLSALRVALIDIGFLYVSNHKVPTEVIQDLVDILPRLFSLITQKAKSPWKTPSIFSVTAPWVAKLQQQRPTQESRWNLQQS